MGRNIEKAIMNFIIDYYSNLGFKEIFSAYFPTVKNKPVLKLYEGFGFEIKKSDEDKKYYKVKISEYVHQKVNYVKVNNHG